MLRRTLRHHEVLHVLSTSVRSHSSSYGMRRLHRGGGAPRSVASAPWMPVVHVSRRHASIRALVRTFGLPLAVYYLLFNETLVVLITYLLHTEAIGAGDIVSFLEYIGLESFVDVRGFSESSRTVLGFEVSGRLVMNFGIATAFMSLWTPIQLPFCVATLPTLMRWLGRGRIQKTAVAPASSGVANSSAPPSG